MSQTYLPYLPCVTTAISLIITFLVAGVGFFNSRSIEGAKAKTSYWNFALQKIMEEYVKYNSTFEVSEVTRSELPERIEERFRECQKAILKVAPLIDQKRMEYLQSIERKYAMIIKSHSGLSKEKLGSNKDNDYVLGTMLDYVNSGHSLLMDEARRFRTRLEGGNQA